MLDVFKLKAGNNGSIWHGWYPPHIIVMDNIGEALGTNSAIKGSDGVSVPPLYIYFLVLLIFFKFRLAKKIEKQAKNRYFDITTNF